MCEDVQLTTLNKLILRRKPKHCDVISSFFFVFLYYLVSFLLFFFSSLILLCVVVLMLFQVIGILKLILSSKGLNLEV